MSDKSERDDELDADQVEDMLARWAPPGAEVDLERFQAAMAYEISRHPDREEIMARHAIGVTDDNPIGEWWWYVVRHDTGSEVLIGLYQKRMVPGTDERRFIATIPLANILRRPEG
jgi:hypothetical protein